MGESSPSAVVSGTTRSQSLAAPEHVTATLLEDHQVHLTWTPGPGGASTVVEVSQGTLLDFEPLTTTDNDGPYGYYPGQADLYTYRLKFVLGDAESAYVESTQITTIVTYEVYLPLVLRSS
jgi:hypothetical protein